MAAEACGRPEMAFPCSPLTSCTLHLKCSRHYHKWKCILDGWRDLQHYGSLVRTGIQILPVTAPCMNTSKEATCNGILQNLAWVLSCIASVRVGTGRTGQMRCKQTVEPCADHSTEESPLPWAFLTTRQIEVCSRGRTSATRWRCFPWTAWLLGPTGWLSP